MNDNNLYSADEEMQNRQEQTQAAQAAPVQPAQQAEQAQVNQVQTTAVQQEQVQQAQTADYMQQTQAPTQQAQPQTQAAPIQQLQTQAAAPAENYEQPPRTNTTPYFDLVEEPVQTESDKPLSKAEQKKKAKKEKKERQEKQGGGIHFFRAAACAILLAVIFGGVAGGTFYGICKYTGVLDRQEVPVVTQKPDTVILPAPEKEKDQQINHVNTDNIPMIATDISGVVEEVVPAMVTILNSYTMQEPTFWGYYVSRDVQSGGTGIIIGENEDELLIATNYHVVADTQKLEITFVDGKTCEAKIKGTDAEMDLAVAAVALKDLEQETRDAIAVAKLGESDELKLGQPAIVIGNAMGIGISVTDGIISGLEREMTTEDGNTGTFIQTNAAVNHGNSGGALLNVRGEVIGIVSNKLSGESVEGMGYAIPISAANPIISELMEHKTRADKVSDEEKGYMGITLQTVNSEAMTYYNMPSGIFVFDVEDGSAAKKAGLIKGDVITKIEGERITTAEQLKEVLAYYRAGETIKVTFSRQEMGEYVSHEIEITLGSRKE